MIRKSATAAARHNHGDGARTEERIEKRWWRSEFIVAGLAVLICTSLWSRAAYAVLGAPADSVPADQARMEGKLATSSRPNFAVEQISTSSGTVVKEYVSPAGTVFAISWRGPRPPDLSHLLGSYFAEYQAAAAQIHPQRRPLRVTTGTVVVEAAGHMRDLRGRAYVPSLIPAGVTTDDIQ
jgi:Protein of unknown function (DUF2844)